MIFIFLNSTHHIEYVNIPIMKVCIKIILQLSEIISSILSRTISHLMVPVNVGHHAFHIHFAMKSEIENILLAQYACTIFRNFKNQLNLNLLQK